MVTMSRLLALAVLLSACAAPASVDTTRDVAPVTTPPPIVTTTTTGPVEYSIQDCSSPPVTFSPLCEVYELLETWHVDRPLDPEDLAEVALAGLAGYGTDDTEAPPRLLQCALPEPDFTGLCEELARLVGESGVPVGPAVEAALTHMVDVGLDPFTYYLPADQVGAFRTNGVVAGIGVLLDARDAAGSKCTKVGPTCRLEVVVALEDNPGFAAGLEPGDIITAVDGESVEGKGFTAIVAEIAGDETGVVVLDVERNGVVSQFALQRAELNVPTVEYADSVAGVGYLRIPDFETDIPDLVGDALEVMLPTNPQTIVVDLRDNPGGYIDSFLEVADEFVDGGVVLVTDGPDEHLEYDALAGGRVTSQRLVVLVNEGTASAAEILAGALRDRRGAVLVGTNTFGKDAVQIAFPLRNGGELDVAVAHWSTPNGDTVTGRGLTPDYQVTWPRGAGFEEIVDIALDVTG